METAKDNTAFELTISSACAFQLRIEMISARLKSWTITDGECVMLMNSCEERRNYMADFIPTPTIGEILKEEFMIPMNLSAYRVANEIHVPVSRIQAILKGKRKITRDTSLRLAKFFGVSDRYFLDLQNDLDMRELKVAMKEEIAEIHPFQAAAI